MSPPSYCEVRGNLTQMFHLTHLGFEHARIHIVATGDQTLKAQVAGEHDDQAVMAGAELVRNPERRRSFD